jgi:hypothetical protein
MNSCSETTSSQILGDNIYAKSLICISIEKNAILKRPQQCGRNSGKERCSREQGDSIETRSPLPLLVPPLCMCLTQGRAPWICCHRWRRPGGVPRPWRPFAATCGSRPTALAPPPPASHPPLPNSLPSQSWCPTSAPPLPPPVLPSHEHRRAPIASFPTQVDLGRLEDGPHQGGGWHKK